MVLPISELPVALRQSWLQHAIAPRPIGFASTISKKGISNLAPFSFFNLFSTEPPIVIFSPSRRVRDNTTKHTLDNILEVPEVVIHIVTYDMVNQVSLASCDFPEGVDEFLKAGFTKETASIVRPAMVKESPVKLECTVNEVKPLGKNGGAGNLIIAEILCMHVDEMVLNEDKTMIDQQKIQHVARLGGDYYSKIDSSNLFLVPKPNLKVGIGIDQLPQHIRENKNLSMNYLALLANVSRLPLADETFTDQRFQSINHSFQEEEKEKQLHGYIKELLDAGNTERAWQLLLR